MNARASSVTRDEPQVIPNHNVSSVSFAVGNNKRTLRSDDFFEKLSIGCFGICAEISNCRSWLYDLKGRKF